MRKQSILALLVALVMLATPLMSLAASGDEYKLAPEMTTYTVMLRRDEADGNWEDLELLKYLEELTNVHFEYDVYYTDEEFQQQLSLQFLSGNYADIIIPRGPGAVRWYEDEEYGKEGYLIDLKPLMEEHMPNLQAFYKEFPALLGGQTAGNGAMYGFPFYYQGGLGGNPHNWYMETYWVNAAGWDDVPNTVYEMDKFVRDIKALMDSKEYIRPEDDMYPLGIQNTNGVTPHANVMLAGFTDTLISPTDPWAVPDNKTVEFMVYHPGFREALEMMAGWFKDGIINPDAFTMDPSAYQANKASTKYAMFTGSSSSLIPELIRDREIAEAEGRDYYGCTAIRPLTSEYSSVPKVGYESFGNINQFMITDKCENPEIIAKWVDLFYNMTSDVTDNSIPHPMHFFRGFYGIHWEYTNEARDEWTFLDRPDGQKNDDGTTLITWDYSRAYLVPGWSLPAGVYIDESFAAGTPMYVAKQKTNAVNEYPYCTTDTQFPPLARWSDEETEAAATKLADLRIYLGQSWGQFLSGERALDDASWDAFIAECKLMGCDEVTAIYQQVFDRWNASLGI